MNSHLSTQKNGHPPNVAGTVSYRLSRAGHVNDWLVAGPRPIPVADLSGYDEVQPRPGILRDFHAPELLVRAEPVEGEILEMGDAHGPAALPWEIKHGGADHFLDFTTFGFTCHYIRTWAYVALHSPVRLPRAKLILTVNGPADMWVNRRHTHSSVDFHFQVPGRHEVTVDLEAGENAIAICFSVVAIRECPYALALQVAHLDPVVLEALEVRLKTGFPSEQRKATEAVLQGAVLERSLYHGDELISLHWREGTPERGVPLRIQLQSQGAEGLGGPEEAPHAHWQDTVLAKTGATLSPGTTRRFSPGPYVFVLEPLDGAFPGQRRIPMRIARGEYSTQPYGTFASRCEEALEVASQSNHPFGEIAKMAQGKWDDLHSGNWAEPLARIRRRADCSDFFLVGMLGALQRFGANDRFPAELREAITESALHFRYWMDEPGCDAMCFHTENHQILFHTCEVLAGQLFPAEVFSNSGQTGAWHAEKGARLALNWLTRKTREGFQEWDSNVYFDIDVLALSHLVDLALGPEVSTMAAIVLDKLFFQIALNSFHGVFGSSHGRVYTDFIKGARLELTSGICRIMWGTGVFNDSIMGAVSLACARLYHLPPVIANIAIGDAQEYWNRERHGGVFNPQSDLQEGSWEVNKATFKTPDYMLCSAQDYFPGKPGNQQHIWQATLGPDAVVFSTHPVCVAEDSAHRPNFWHGNGILPRVVQWKSTLIALYNLPANDWMGFTHAYFSTVHFDEWTSRSGWIFARKQEGYIALYASGGLDLATSPSGAREELRSYGHETVWLCQMGRASRDGGFVEFQDSVLAAPMAISGLDVRISTISGDQLAFSWKGDFHVNGQVEKITGFAHYENPYCRSELNAPRLRIQAGKDWLEWDFEKRTRAMSGPVLAQYN